MTVQPPTGQAGMAAPHWAGLTQSLEAVGQDFSGLRYLEIWVNDFTSNHALTQAKLHIDFGRVSEDAFWDTDNSPNFTLDTEDKNGDSRLDVDTGTDAEALLRDEDTGLDGLHDVEEPGYTGSGSDPNADNYFYDLDNGPSDYARINNTEGNSKGDPNGRPDTEDLNRDGFLDESNEYFEATVDLSDTAFVAIDVPRDYANNPALAHPIRADNGWRLFRIPVDAVAFKAVNTASWDYVSHVRLWLNGMAGATTIQIGGIDPVGVPLVASSQGARCRAFPNPSTAEAAFQVTMPQAGRARLRLYDLRGRLIVELFDESMPVGQHVRGWNGKDSKGNEVASGVYLFRLETQGSNASGRVVLVR
jgi:cell surface protein SprA